MQSLHQPSQCLTASSEHSDDTTTPAVSATIPGGSGVNRDDHQEGFQRE